MRNMTRTDTIEWLFHDKTRLNEPERGDESSQPLARSAVRSLIGTTKKQQNNVEKQENLHKINPIIMMALLVELFSPGIT